MRDNPVSMWKNYPTKKTTTFFELMKQIKENETIATGAIAASATAITVIATGGTTAPITTILTPAVITMISSIAFKTFNAECEKASEEYALKHLAFYGCLEGVQLAINAGVDIECRTVDRVLLTDLPPHKIATAIYEKIYNFFTTGVPSSPTVESMDESWMNASPLMCAAYKGHINIVHFLFEKGAALSRKTGDGKTVLDYAQDQKGARNQEVIHFLEEKMGLLTYIVGQ